MKNDILMALVKALAESLRLGVLSVIAILITSLEAGQEIDWRVIGVLLIVATLKGADKFLHELGDLRNNEVLLKGITRF